jgi:hypothetical protein
LPQPGTFIIHTAPDFNLSDERMAGYLESLIVTHDFSIIFLDTYQKATPGLGSFDDEKQAVILHRLANLTRKHNVTTVVLDHVRKRTNGKKRNELTVDDIKGTGGKAQNADCVILLERTTDRKQAKLQSFSKDSDVNVRMLLDISPRGSSEPKFKYVGDLDELGQKSADHGKANRLKVLNAMTLGEWTTAPIIAETLKMANSTVQGHLKKLMTEGKVADNGLKGRYHAYQRIADSQTGDENSTPAMGAS